MASYIKKGKGYLITVCDGYDENGRQKKYRHQWNPDVSLKTEEDILAALKLKMQEYEDLIKLGQIVRPGNTKFSKVLEEYYNGIANEAENDERSELTVDRYLQEKKRLSSVFGHKPIA